MARPGNNKKRCEKYSRSGHKELNKQLRQERNEKRIARFKKRREEGKTYQYKPNPYKEDTSDWVREKLIRHEKSLPYRHMTEHEKWKSIMRKLNNELAAQEKAEKALQNSGRGKSRRSSPLIDGDEE